MLSEAYGSVVNYRGASDLVFRLLNGASETNLGRPRFLFDEIYGKSLFGSTAPSARSYDEGGPNVSLGVDMAYESGEAIEAANIALRAAIQATAAEVVAGNAVNIAVAREAEAAARTRLQNAQRTRISHEPRRPFGGPNADQVVLLSYATDGKYNVDSPQVSVRIGAAAARKLDQVSKARFDTTLVRNLFFITNVNRVLRMALTRQLTVSRDVIRSSHPAVAVGVTEFGYDPFTPNEGPDSKYMTGVSRYADQDGV